MLTGENLLLAGYITCNVALLRSNTLVKTIQVLLKYEPKPFFPSASIQTQTGASNGIDHDEHGEHFFTRPRK